MLNRFAGLLLAILFLSCNLFSQGRKELDSLLLGLKQPAHDTVRAKQLNKAGWICLRTGKMDSAGYFLSEALKFAEKHHFTRVLASGSNGLARYYGFVGKHDSALHYYDVAISFFRLRGDSSQVAGVYNNIGNVYKDLGNIPASLDNYYKSLRLKETLGDSTAIASACTNLGHLYHSFGDSVNALKFLNRALSVRLRLKDSVETANLFVILANHYRDRGDFEKAGNFLRQAVSILSRSEDAEGYAIACYNFGTFLMAQNQLEAAGTYLEQAYGMAQRIGDPEGLASCLEMMAEVNMRQKKFARAATFYERALVQAEKAQISDLLQNVHGNLARAYEMLGKFDAALYHFKRGITLRDSLFNIENIQKLTSTELKYQHEKEKLELQHEQEQKEAIQKEQNFRKNLVLAGAALLIIIVSMFSGVLARRLRINRQQREIIQEQNAEILDSIKYARRIQSALLPKDGVLKQDLAEFFVLFKPRNLVSGDFYWSVRTDSGTGTNSFLLAVCDSTGHGVPGAFMSLLNIGFLNEAVSEKEILQPHQIFNYVRQRLTSSIAEEDQKDGMDGILLLKDPQTGKWFYAAANNHPVVIRNKVLVECEYDKMPVGKGDLKRDFRLFELPAGEGDLVYLYTDGYADQFGGPRGKKFKYRQLNDLLLNISEKPMHEQRTILEKRFEEWRGELEQVDDVCIVCFRV